jgi:cytochrome c nitrite reductase small subunit
MPPLRWPLLLSIGVGIPLGVGTFTFGYAKGLSYFSSDPAACANCHVMRDTFDAWAKSGHHHVATCVECHLPHAGLAKWLATADEGFRHSSAFTLQNFAEPIRITPGDRDIVLENCVRCHAVLVDDIHAGGAGRDREPDCLHCHAEAGHGAGG